MPIYEYLCPRHGRFSVWENLSERHKPQRCRAAGCPEMGGYVISAPIVFSDYKGYISPSTGEWVEGRRARENDLAKSNCRPYEEGERQDLEVRKRLVEAKQEAELDAAVEKTLWEITN